MIGLKRGIVRLYKSDSSWKEEFLKEKEFLQKALGKLAVDIQHVGSTAIQGISAKPIIDIAIGVHSLSPKEVVVSALQKAGYEYMPNRGTAGRMFFAKGPDNNRTHYVHLCRYKNKEWDKMIVFRDKLNLNPKLAEEYNYLKKQLYKKFKDNREKYSEGKHNFINKVISL